MNGLIVSQKMPRSRSKIRKEVAEVTKMMARASVGGRSRSRSRGRSSGRPGNSRRRRTPSRARTPGPGRRNNLSAGEIVVEMTEAFYIPKLVSPAKTLSMYVGFHPESDKMEAGHFKALAKVYKRFKFTSVSLEYQGTVGSTVGGNIIVGVTYDPPPAPAEGKSYDFSFAQVAACSPNRQSAPWKNWKMVVPIAKMAPQRWLETVGETEASAGGVLLRVDCDKTEPGYLRIHYVVHFAGPNL